RDNWFRGFPAAWNLVAPVMFLMEVRTVVGSIITLVLSVLCLTNVPFPHIARARFLRPVTIVGATVLIGGIVIGTFAYPDHPHYVRVPLYVGSAYFLVLSAIRWWYERTHRRAETPTDASAAETR
ncbi:MAG TPA: hypothetical protein VFU35_12720, partial [Jatrophihabitans sp.]|nr:hypothetical protein [Jatrophihabitans sp.]